VPASGHWLLVPGRLSLGRPAARSQPPVANDGQNADTYFSLTPLKENLLPKGKPNDKQDLF